MAEFKWNKSVRTEIINKLLREIFAPKFEEVFNSFAEEGYKIAYKNHYCKEFEALPEPARSMVAKSNHLTIHQNSRIRNDILIPILDRNIIASLKIKKNVYCGIYSSLSYSSVDVVLVTDTLTKLNKLVKQAICKQAELEVAFNSCTTYKKAIATFPNLEKYMPESAKITKTGNIVPVSAIEVVNKLLS